ncbi:protein teflon [Drosophila bipectinata]|uniref:protein teflon n=1 Tax=Drosophila bipectinata TaxID=42026 RepID=UPI0038B3691F
MTSFLDLLEGNDVNFEKCGDVVISPKNNMVALFCHFCRDMFTGLPKFVRHLQLAHGDVLPFNQEQNVYSVEELMSSSGLEEDRQSPGIDTSSGDSGMHGESDEPNTEEVPPNPPKRKKEHDSKNVVAEVEAMLFSSDSHKEAQEQDEQLVIKNDRCQVAKRGPLRVCNLKSHTIARQSRKRLTHIKKHILKTLKENVLEPAKEPGIFNVTTTTTKLEAQTESIESTVRVQKSSLGSTSTLLVENQFKRSISSQQVQKRLKSSSKSIIRNVEVLSPINVNSPMTVESLLSESLKSEKNSKKIKAERLSLENNFPKPIEPFRNREQLSNTKIQCYTPKKPQIKAAIQSQASNPVLQDKPITDLKDKNKESSDLVLLISIGLPIIYNLKYEDRLMQEDVDELHKKAAKFCEIYKKHDSVWNTRKIKGPLDTILANFVKDLNREMGCTLKVNELKRLLNQISSWFTGQVDMKFFHKIEPSSSVNHYLNLFSFVPRYNRFLYFCDNCDEHFTTEARFRKHLLKH